MPQMSPMDWFILSFFFLFIFFLLGSFIYYLMFFLLANKGLNIKIINLNKYLYIW